MGITVESSVVAPPLSVTHKCFGIAKSVANEAFTYTKYLYWLSLFAQSIIDGIKQIHEPPSIVKSNIAQKFAYLNKGFLTYMNGVLLFVDLKELLIPDEKGRWIWERHGQYICEKLSWTTAHTFDFVDFLTIVNVVKLTTLSASVLSLASVIFKVGAAAFGIWECARSINHTNSKRKKLCELKAVWLKRSEGWHDRHEISIQKIAKWEQRLKDPKVSHKKNIQANIVKWQTIQACKDNKKLKQFCIASFNRNFKMIQKCDAKLIVLITKIAVHSSLILLAGLGLAAHFAGLGRFFSVKVTLIALPVIFTSLELGHLAMEKFLKIPRVPKLKFKKMLEVEAELT